MDARLKGWTFMVVFGPSAGGAKFERGTLKGARPFYRLVLWRVSIVLVGVDMENAIALAFGEPV